MKRNWRPRILAAVTVGCLAAAPSAAAELPSPEPTLTATGRAAIYHDDVAGARERAVHAALIRGLERYGGLRIESSTLIKKGELIDREVRAHTRGYVRSYEVLESRREGDELGWTTCTKSARAERNMVLARMASTWTRREWAR